MGTRINTPSLRNMARPTFHQMTYNDAGHTSLLAENANFGQNTNFSFFVPADEGKTVDGHERKIPDRFSSDDDEIFERSMIATYAIETCGKDGKDGKHDKKSCKPNG